MRESLFQGTQALRKESTQIQGLLKRMRSIMLMIHRLMKDRTWTAWSWGGTREFVLEFFNVEMTFPRVRRRFLESSHKRVLISLA